MEDQMALTGNDLLNMINGFQMTQVLVTASTLGIFEELHSKGQVAETATSVATSLRTNPDATARLMNSCAGLGLLEKNLSSSGEEVYRNARAAEKYLVTTSAMSIAPLVAKIGDLYHIWGKLRQGVKDGKSLSHAMVCNSVLPNGVNGTTNGLTNGKNGTMTIGTTNGVTSGMTNGMGNGITHVPNPIPKVINSLPNGLTSGGANHGTNGISNGLTIQNGNKCFEKGNANGIFMNEAKTQEFLKCMHIFCKMDAPFVTSAFDLSEFKTVCDLGGATGAMAVELCSTFSNMNITVLDLPNVIAAAPKFNRNLPKRINFKSGDFFKDELPPADLYLLSHVVHDWNDEKADFLLKKIYKSLRPGGALLVLEKMLNEEKDGPMMTLLFDLGMLMLNEGRERTAQEYRTLLSKHGFQDIQVKVLEKSQYRDAILARKPMTIS